MGKSSIEWTDETWNAVRGCDKVSPGCKHCYAETFAERFRGVPGHPYEQGFDLRLVPEKLDAPLHWTKPRRVFVNSMSDLFHEGVPNEYIAAVFGVMAACPQHTFQVLTKRAQRLPEWFAWVHEKTFLQADKIRGEARHCIETAINTLPFSPDRLMDARTTETAWPLPNVWLGVSVEDQKRADERIPHLLRVPAAVRFLSCEPLLEAVTLWSNVEGVLRGPAVVVSGGMTVSTPDEAPEGYDDSQPGVDWVIVGGESGAGARPMRLEWARSIVEQCKAAGVACFVKQLGPKAWEQDDPTAPASIAALHGLKFPKKGGDWDLWPADLRVREWPVSR